MTTLVTGATGFVGAAVVRRLLARGETVRVLTRPASDRSNIDDLPVEIALGDLLAPDSLPAAFSGCRSLYHVAADYRLWAPKPEAMYQANVEGSRNLIRHAMAAGVERIVYTSSVAVLGRTADGRPADEETPVTIDDMIGHYKRSKFLAEEAVRSLIAEEDAPVTIVNPSTPIGPRDIKPTPTGRMIVEAAAGRMPAYVDTGLNIVHVDDVAEGHLLAHDRGRIGERYVLGGQDMTLAEILGAIAEIVGRPPPKVRLPHNLILPIAVLAESWARLFKTGEPFVTIDGIRMAKKRMFFSSAKAKAALGYSHRPPQDALRDAVAWFEGNGYLK
ncbi:MAG: NAD-dependent epimerase/dehydratase family protein [Rhodospirillaceae bacterium]|nr:NAD-dependent epimerase/dehydratase family protein [Rhodospirillaceae bacterium]MDD9928941.1 NAD-dependent epimerase/dehydratase family protein [Rhodospirillaceae bacterium]